MLKASESRDDIIVKYDTLCQSLNKNEVPLLTITSQLDERSVNVRIQLLHKKQLGEFL